MPTYREYYCYDDFNAMHGIKITKEECPWIDDEVPQEVIDKDLKDAAEYNKRVMKEEAEARAKRSEDFTRVCTDPNDPWFGQSRHTYGFKESMYAISPRGNRGMGW